MTVRLRLARPSARPAPRVAERKLSLGLLKGHQHGAHSLACHPSEPLLVSCSVDALLLWSTTELTRLRALSTPPTRALQQALFVPSLDPGGGLLATCFERSVTLWDLRTLSPTLSLQLPVAQAGGRLRALAVSADGGLVLAGGEGGRVTLWDSGTGDVVHAMQLHGVHHAVEQLAFLPPSVSHLGDAVCAAIVTADGCAHQLDFSRHTVRAALRPPAAGGVRALALDPTMATVCAIHIDGSLALNRADALCPPQGGEDSSPPFARPGPRAPLSPPPHADADADGVSGGGGEEGGGGAHDAPGKRGGRGLDQSRPSIEIGGVAIASRLPLAERGDLSPNSLLLDVPRLRALVRNAGALPRKYRLHAWRFLLQLPANEAAHGALLSRGAHPSYAEMQRRLPLERRSSTRLERLCSCLAHWCPLMAEAAELPSAVFPWLLAFGADDLGAFEAAATVLSVWAQAFFTCHPQPPPEMLGATDALLSHHAPALHAHLHQVDAGPDAWAWPLLRSFFARVLPREDWATLWDHLLCHEPTFLLVVTVAFAKMHAGALYLASNAEQVQRVLHRPSALQMRAWLRCAYTLGDETPDYLLPAWSHFRPLPRGAVYPQNIDFPKTIVDFGQREVWHSKPPLRPRHNSQRGVDRHVPPPSPPPRDPPRDPPCGRRVAAEWPPSGRHLTARVPAVSPPGGQDRAGGG